MSNENIKLAAYYQGVYERAREYGFSDNQTTAIIKQANVSETLGNLGGYVDKGVDALKGYGNSALEALKGAGGTINDKVTGAGLGLGDLVHGMADRAHGLGEGFESGGLLQRLISGAGDKSYELAELIKNNPRAAALLAGGAGAGALAGGGYLAHKALSGDEEAE